MPELRSGAAQPLSGHRPEGQVVGRGARHVHPRKRGPRGETAAELESLLRKPVTAAELVVSLGVSRQRVDHLLKGLMASGRARRVARPNSPGRWLWMGQEVDAGAATLRGPLLGAGQVRTLSCLRPNTLHWVRDVAARVGMSPAAVTRHVDDLVAAGLATAFTLGNRRLVAIAQGGLEHPARDKRALRAPAADPADTMGRRRLAFLLALASLGEARTADLTAAVAEPGSGGTELHSGQMVALLQKAGLVEQGAEAGGAHPTYRLTEAGLRAVSFVSRENGIAPREATLARLAAFREERAARQREAMRRHAGEPAAFSPAQVAALGALGGGPMTTSSLVQAVGAHLRNRRSVNLMLRTLAARGAVEEAGKLPGGLKVWRLRSEAS